MPVFSAAPTTRSTVAIRRCHPSGAFGKVSNRTRRTKATFSKGRVLSTYATILVISLARSYPDEGSRSIVASYAVRTCSTGTYKGNANPSV